MDGRGLLDTCEEKIYVAGVTDKAQCRGRCFHAKESGEAQELAAKLLSGY